MENNQIIHEFQKNAIEKVRTEFCEYRGKGLINIRVFFQANPSGNEWLPTRKGITMSAELIPELKEAMDKAYKQWKKQTKE